MSEQRINLAALRASTDERHEQSLRLMNTTRDAHAWEDYRRAVRYSEDVLALVEAVEAAHAVISTGALVIHQEWADADAALARFSFGPRP